MAWGTAAAVQLQPKSELLDRLTALEICTPADWRPARAYVRRLARDLPAFDTVWVDALVQARRLTPFQARMLEQGTPEDLRIGPCVILDQLGRGRNSATYLTRHVTTRERLVVKLTNVSPERHRDVLSRLGDLTHLAASAAQAGVITPREIIETDRGVACLSDDAGGLPLTELVIRRGRFPSRVVTAIARQLAYSLSRFERLNGVHGDLRPDNVRLRASGELMLVDAGVATAVEGPLSMHAAVPPDRYDGIAPELIGTGELPTTQSDVYAFGCLLWSLLCGRPPFPTGDPLAKLAAHRTKPIDEILNWVPDVPETLCRAIGECTRHVESERPANWADISRLIGSPTRRDHRTLASFYAQFRYAAPATGMRFPILVTGLKVIGGTAAILLVAAGLFIGPTSGIANALFAVTNSVEPAEQVLPQPVAATASTALANSIGDSADSNASDAPPFEETSDDPGPNLPVPDADGRIVLLSGVSYPASSISREGPLIITAEPNAEVPPRIVSDSGPWRLNAASIEMSGVEVIGTSPSATAPANSRPVLVLAESQRLSVRRCRFIGTDLGSDSEQNDLPIAVAWRSTDRLAATAAAIEVESVSFSGDLVGIFCSVSPDTLSARNLLKTGAGPAFVFRDRANDNFARRIELQNVALRDSGPLLQWSRAPAGNERDSRVTIEATDCVFAPSAETAIIVVTGPPFTATQSEPSLELIGENCVVRHGTRMLRHQGQADSGERNDHVTVEGLWSADVVFAGTVDGDVHSSVINSASIPTQGGRVPGILPDGFLKGHIAERPTAATRR